MTQAIRNPDAIQTLGKSLSEGLLPALLDPDLPVPEGLLDGQGRPAGRRFAVYRNNVASSLVDALEAGFPSVFKLLGAENFRPLARLFARETPPNSPLLFQYGAEFPAFLAGIPALSRFPYLPAMAKLDQALRESYHAADNTPFSLENIASQPFDTLTFHFAPSARILAVDHPVFSIWTHLQTGAPIRENAPETVLIARADFTPAPHLLAPAEAAFVTALTQGQPLGLAHESTLAHHPDFDPTPALSLLFSSGALTSGSPT